MDKVVESRPRLLLASDLDWTMVDHNDPGHANLLKFNELWKGRLGGDSVLVFSTGRSPHLFHRLAEEVPLLKPDILVCSVGTEILVGGSPDAAWERHLDEGWDRQKAAAVAAKVPDLALQEESEQRPHKVSFKLKVPDPDRPLSALREGLARAGLDANVIFSGGEDLDILPARASKGKALTFLLRQIEGSVGAPTDVLVAGDSGNDVELFAVPGVKGCVVGNAQPELLAWCDGPDAPPAERLFRATERGPGGIVQALQHFGLVAAPNLAEKTGED